MRLNSKAHSEGSRTSIPAPNKRRIRFKVTDFATWIRIYPKQEVELCNLRMAFHWGGRKTRCKTSTLKWEKHFAEGIEPRKNHTTTVVGGRLYTVMGYSLKKLRRLNDVRVLQANSSRYEEKKLDIHGEFIPLNKDGHTANLVNDKIYILGGSDNRGLRSDVLVLDLVLQEWLLVKTLQDNLPTLSMHTSDYIKHWDQILCFGGGDGKTFVNSVNCLDIDSHAWSELNPKGTAPAQRGNHLSCMVRNSLVIYGGRAHGPYNWFNDVHVLHLSKVRGFATWSSVEISNPPGIRIEAALGVLGEKLILYGGFNKTFLDETHFLELETEEWSRPVDSQQTSKRRSLQTLGIRGSAPTPRRGHTLTQINATTLLLYGGYTLDPENNTFYTLAAKQ